MRTQGSGLAGSIGFTSVGMWIGVLAASLIHAAVACGEVIMVRVEGTVTTIDRLLPSEFDLDGSVNVGDPYELTYLLDTSAPDSDPDPVVGAYPVIAAAGRVGNYAWTEDSPSGTDVEGVGIRNDRQSNPPEPELNDGYSLLLQEPRMTATFEVNGDPIELDSNSLDNFHVMLYLEDSTARLLSSDALIVPSLEAWDFRDLSINFRYQLPNGNKAGATVVGTVDRISQVPEPGTLPVLSLLALTFLRRGDRTSGVRSVTITKRLYLILSALKEDFAC